MLNINVNTKDVTINVSEATANLIAALDCMHEIPHFVYTSIRLQYGEDREDVQQALNNVGFEEAFNNLNKSLSQMVGNAISDAREYSYKEI